MATQTRFNLTAAIESWLNELAAQPQLSPDDRRELEKHLTDSMAELRQRGLNDEEAFWLACRRTGPPRQIAEEFEKADPAKIWRARTFWMITAILIAYLFANISVSIADFLCSWFPSIARPNVEPMISMLIWFFELLGCLSLLMWQKIKKRSSYFEWLVQDRLRYAIVMIGVVLVVNIIRTGIMFGAYTRFSGIYSPSGPFLFIWRGTIYSLIQELGLTIMLILIVPVRDQKVSQPA